ncbi:MAG: hypothetical protein U0103_11690 [Candidatus Obscuribacterales bacterium]
MATKITADASSSVKYSADHLVLSAAVLTVVCSMVPYMVPKKVIQKPFSKDTFTFKDE